MDVVGSKMKEDCTNKDFYVWHLTDDQVPDDMRLPSGVEVQDDAFGWKIENVQEAVGWSSSCVAFVQQPFKDKQSCSDWCGDHGLQCVKAMDDASGSGGQQALQTWLQADGKMVLSQCTLGERWEAHKKANIPGYLTSRGCNFAANSQICACATTTTTTSPLLAEGQWCGWHDGDMFVCIRCVRQYVMSAWFVC